MTINELSSYLASQPANTKDTPYSIALKIDKKADFKILSKTLNDATDKYVNIDLSGSTITIIPSFAFLVSSDFIIRADDSLVFPECATLTGIIIPEGIKRICKFAFRGSINLTRIVIPDSVKNIGIGAFSRCTNLTSVIIGKGVIKIKINVFSDCQNLIDIYVSTENSTYTSEDGVLYNKSKTILIKYPGQKPCSSFTIPNSVRIIEETAFEFSSYLENLFISDNVKIIKNGAFFFTSLVNITLPNKVKRIGKNTFALCESLESVNIPNSVKCIGTKAFRACFDLTSVTFECMIPSICFSINAFIGDLREKFYAKNAVFGTPGTYTTTAPVNKSSVWTQNRNKLVL
jgi:hypothetical protein